MYTFFSLYSRTAKWNDDAAQQRFGPQNEADTAAIFMAPAIGCPDFPKKCCEHTRTHLGESPTHDLIGVYGNVCPAFQNQLHSASFRLN